MKDIPDNEVIGDVYKFGVEAIKDGKAVLAAYTKNENGSVGRPWIRFNEDATRSLKYLAEKI